ncbi:hypothetical protein MAPG_11736 [Magnaporthiopsis poae ATCC 64411]|uniref:Rhodopsin domain-containing protein n=1 Tax=Magnaporthiopsis poae (strain ATCC 64411 / 73-15) TaxID=644358 RepID=A0A0C4EG22_MAGP6|nr:hypothetical protein MAPG_11736 [Magnaporthiopsis poae ATCC 64411]
MAEGPPSPPTQIRTETNGPIVTGIGIGFLVVNVVFTALRFYTRATILKAIGKDDWAILIATILSIVYSIALFYEVKYGMGRHAENVTMAETIEQLKFLMLGIASYNAGMNVAKLGFLFQYRRIFQDKFVRTVCFWFIVYVCFWAVLQLTLLFLACFPLSIVVPTMAGKCLDTLPVWYSSSVMSMVTDIFIFCIPLPSVWKLQLPTRQRVLVMGIFCLGFL